MCKYKGDPSSSFLLICETDDNGGSREFQSTYNTCYVDGNSSLADCFSQANILSSLAQLYSHNSDNKPVMLAAADYHSTTVNSVTKSLTS